MIDKEFAKQLIAQFNSPLYVYDLVEVECQAERLFSILPDDSKLFYSFKANPLPALGRLLCKLGCQAEVSSTMELESALEVGFSPDDILYSGPGKTVTEIELALAANVKTFSSESWHDLNRLDAIATEVRQRVKVLLRVNPSTPPKAQLAMAGVSSQFGFEEEDLSIQASKLQTLKSIEIVGLHIYFGSQIAYEALMPTIQSVLEVSEKLSKQLDLSFQIIDVGGGFPWPYAVLEEGLDLSGLGIPLSKIAEQRNLTASSQLWFESGRYLVASSGTLLTTVLAVKEAKNGKKFVILDAGINHLGGMTGLGRILRPTISIEPLEIKQSGDLETFDIVGPLCSPLDCLARNVKAPKLLPGDIIAIPNVGAYGLTASLTGFLSRPTPHEITYRDKQYYDVYRLQTGHQKIKSKSVRR